MLASTPSTATESLAAVPLKPDPVMVTRVPALPLSGVKELTVTVLPVLVLLQLNTIDKRTPDKRRQQANFLFGTRILWDLKVPNYPLPHSRAIPNPGDTGDPATARQPQFC